MLYLSFSNLNKGKETFLVYKKKTKQKPKSRITQFEFQRKLLLIEEKKRLFNLNMIFI